MNESLHESHETDKESDPSQEIADLLAGYGEEYGFDFDTCDEIEALLFEEAFEVAYSYLTQAGLDADEVLSSFMEQPEEEASAE